MSSDFSWMTETSSGSAGVPWMPETSSGSANVPWAVETSSGSADVPWAVETSSGSANVPPTSDKTEMICGRDPCTWGPYASSPRSFSTEWMAPGIIGPYASSLSSSSSGNWNSSANTSSSSGRFVPPGPANQGQILDWEDIPKLQSPPNPYSDAISIPSVSLAQPKQPDQKSSWKPEAPVPTPQNYSGWEFPPTKIRENYSTYAPDIPIIDSLISKPVVSDLRGRTFDEDLEAFLEFEREAIDMAYKARIAKLKYELEFESMKKRYPTKFSELKHDAIKELRVHKPRLDVKREEKIITLERPPTIIPSSGTTNERLCIMQNPSLRPNLQSPPSLIPMSTPSTRGTRLRGSGRSLITPSSMTSQRTPVVSPSSSSLMTSQRTPVVSSSSSSSMTSQRTTVVSPPISIRTPQEDESSRIIREQNAEFEQAQLADALRQIQMQEQEELKKVTADIVSKTDAGDTNGLMTLMTNEPRFQDALEKLTVEQNEKYVKLMFPAQKITPYAQDEPKDNILSLKVRLPDNTTVNTDVSKNLVLFEFLEYIKQEYYNTEKNLMFTSAAGSNLSSCPTNSTLEQCGVQNKSVVFLRE